MITVEEGRNTVDQLQIWDMRTLAHVKDLRGHRSAITALSFRINSPHLFSVSKDRTSRVS